MFRILFMICMLSCLASSAQHGEVIRDREQILTTTPADTAARRKIVLRARQLSRAHPDSAMRLLTAVFEDSATHADPPNAVVALRTKGDILCWSGHYDSGLHVYKSALPYMSENGVSVNETVLLFRNISRGEQLQGAQHQAFLYLFKALTLLNHQDVESDTRAAVYQLFATALMAVASPYQEGADSVPDAVMFYNDLARYWSEMAGNKYRTAQIVMNKGVFLRMRGTIAESRHYFLQTLAAGRSLPSANTTYLALLNLAKVSMLSDVPDSALLFLGEAKVYLPEAQPYHRVDYYMYLGEAQIAKQRFAQARDALLEAQALAGFYSLQYIQTEIHRLLSVCYEALGDPVAALRYYRLSMEAQKNFISRTEMEKFRKMELQYRTAEKDRELYRRQLMIARQRQALVRKNMIIGGSLAGVLIAAGVAFFSYRYYRQRRRAQENRIHMLNQEQEISRLKSMMQGEEKERRRLARELHDGIGGMLATLRLYLDTVKMDMSGENHHVGPQLDKAMFLLDDTAEEVRKTAHNLLPDILVRNGLQKALEIYCAGINATGQLEVLLHCYNLPTDMGKSTELMVYRIVQELTLNIIKHARASRAEVQILSAEDILTITVEDNGVGFHPDTEHAGSGLENLRFRVQALHGYISITSSPGHHTTVHIDFDLKKLKQADTI